MAGIMKTVRLARQAFVLNWMADNPGPRDLFGPTACIAGVWRKDAASASLVGDFARAFGIGDEDAAARAMGLVMRHLEGRDLVRRRRVGIEGGGSRNSWHLSPQAQAALEAGVQASTLLVEEPGVPAPDSPSVQEDPVTGTALPADTSANLYLAVEVEAGEDVRFHWRGGADAAEAAERMRAEGRDPVFVESLKGGRPGHWSRAEAEAGIVQMEMEA